MKKILLGLLALTSLSSFALSSDSIVDTSVETIFESTDGSSFYCLNKDSKNTVWHVTKVKRVIAGETIRYELYNAQGFASSCESVIN